MTTLNVSSGRNQVLVDEQQLQRLQSEFSRRALELERLKSAFETLSAVNAPARFMAAAMALCNELAARFKAERVGVGFLKGRYVRLQALSHTEKITRHMQLVQDIEASMEECLDQDVEVVVPPPKDASFVYRASQQLSLRHGPSAVANLPLRRKQALAKKADRELESDVVAVLSLERTADKPFTVEELETLRLAGDLLTARLVDLYEQDRWIGSKILRDTRKVLSWAVGTKHTWAKAAAIAICALLAFAIFFKSTYQVESPFVLEATERQLISAPYDSDLISVSATAGDFVFTEATAERFDAINNASSIMPLIPFRRPVTVLATLKTSELRSKLLAAQNEEQNYIQQAKLYRAPKEGPPSEAQAQMADFEAKKARANIELYEHQIAQAKIKTPVDGIVLSGDLKSKIGAPVKAGDELFQVGQPDIRAELSVPEDMVADVKVGQSGTLAASSFPSQKIPFKVERVFPVANVTAGHNVFKVRVVFEPGAQRAWMRPGMEGIAKVDIQDSSYLWIYTHRLVNWARMKMWEYTPF